MASSQNMLSAVRQAPEDPMFGLSAAFRNDKHPRKVDLGVGAYRDDYAKPWVLPTVKKADDILRRNPDIDHEYLPIAGSQDYLHASQRLLFCENNEVIRNQKVASLQTLSGTGALHLGALFLARFIQSTEKKVYVSDPPYVNHIPILQHASLNSETYPYYSSTTKRIDLNGLLTKLDAIPNNSTVLLHACAHNPTGVDPSRDEWKQIAATMKAKGHLPFFDCAYQGFASGSLDDDAWSIRYFIDQGFECVMVAQSYAKNFGLYGERAGCLHVVAPDSRVAGRVFSQLQRLQRVTVSTPPAYGARIVSLILNDKTLYQQWIQDLQTMAGRIIKMRKALRTHLEKIGAPGNWDHITRQSGMFCYTGLSEGEVERLRKVYHIYTTKNGRISIAGLNTRNVEYVAEAFKEVLTRARL